MSVAETAASLRELAEQSNAWPFEEARKIVARLKKQPKDEVIFETGYGPSGLPHIGTFGEVARTTMVRHAFRVLTDDKIKTRLIAFSDDMDGLRKVPDNVPNKEMLEKHLGKPLTQVPDPFGTHPSFGAHNNARLRAFLDHFGFDYEFMSSTDCYTSGRFDAALLKVLERFDKVMAIMLPSLREERAATYSPFLPIDPKTGIVLQVPVLAHDAKAGTITYEDPDTQSAGHHAGHRRALQAAMEAGLGDALGGARRRLRNGRQGPDRFGQAVGRDLPRARRHAAGRLQLRALPRRERPEDFQVEGQRPHHRRMAALCVAGKPVAASCTASRRRPSGSTSTSSRAPSTSTSNSSTPIRGRSRASSCRIRSGTSIPAIRPRSRCRSRSPCCSRWCRRRTRRTPRRCGASSAATGRASRRRRIRSSTRRSNTPSIISATSCSRRKKFRQPTDVERAALIDLRDALANLPATATAEEIQDVVYEVGRREPFLDQKKKAKDGKPGVSLDWFNMLYQVLLGQEKGPRFGSFVAVYGLQNTVDMIDGALARSA